MRNLFDQYDQPENRLSHALAVRLQAVVEQRGGGGSRTRRLLQ